MLCKNFLRRTFMLNKAASKSEEDKFKTEEWSAFEFLTPLFKGRAAKCCGPHTPECDCNVYKMLSVLEQERQDAEEKRENNQEIIDRLEENLAKANEKIIDAERRLGIVAEAIA